MSDHHRHIPEEGLIICKQNQDAVEPFLQQLHSLLMYSHSNRAILKLRDQKQLDFEELSAYLSNVGGERDRLAAIISGRAGSSGLGLGSYLRDRVDALRGLDDDRTRVERMRKLDIKIKEVRILESPESPLNESSPPVARGCYSCSRDFGLF